MNYKEVLRDATKDFFHLKDSMTAEALAAAAIKAGDIDSLIHSAATRANIKLHDEEIKRIIFEDDSFDTMDLRDVIDEDSMSAITMNNLRRGMLHEKLYDDIREAYDDKRIMG